MRGLERHSNGRLLTGFICGLVFLLLAMAVRGNWTTSLDEQARGWILSLNTPLLVRIWKCISFLGSVLLLTTLTITWIGALGYQRRWHTALWLSVTGLGATVLDVSLKWLVHRPRPEEIYSGTMPESFSFPSGHAFYSLVLYTAIFSTLQPLFPTLSALYFATPAVLLAIFVGASRVFLGVHYLSDVLGGYLLAWAWLCLMLELQPVAALHKSKT